jgi:FkbM family methyltransferase
MQSNSFVRNLSGGIRKRIRGMMERPGQKAGLNWLRIKFLKHAAPDQERVHMLQGQPLYYTRPAELLHGLREIFMDEVYRIDLPANAYILDCGANIGMSVRYLKEHFPQATVIAFEPDEQNYKLLHRNAGALPGVTLRKEAVWTQDTELSFASDGTMGSKISGEGGGNIQKVKAVRLRDFLDRPVDFLKIDIEGAEYEVMKDIADKLANVRYLFLEYHGRFHQNAELVEMLSIVEKAGLSFYIKEAAEVYKMPFAEYKKSGERDYDLQLNIFCIRR